MNRKGFTLIELLAVIVIISLLGVLIVPGLIKNTDTSKQKSYEMLLYNITVSSRLYYEECEYGDLSNTSKYGSYACSMSNNEINTTLSSLANTGVLKVSTSKKLEDGTEVKTVINPITNEDISSCSITIKKEVTKVEDDNKITNYKTEYKLISNSNNCPTTKEYIESE